MTYGVQETMAGATGSNRDQHGGRRCQGAARDQSSLPRGARRLTKAPRAAILGRCRAAVSPSCRARASGGCAVLLQLSPLKLDAPTATRFLRAKKGDAAAAAGMFRAHLAWRAAERVDELWKEAPLPPPQVPTRGP